MIIIDKHLKFKEYMAQSRLKLNRTNSLLAKLRHQVSSSLLKTIYFTLFDSHIRMILSYLCMIQYDVVKKPQCKAF